MNFKLSVLDRHFFISITQILIKAKFRCYLDIFIKNGSQKEQLFQGLKIDDCKVIFPNIKTDEQIKVISLRNAISKNQKILKKCYLTFQLRSKSYNAYAGQVQLILDAQKKSKYKSKIQNCVDEDALIVYQVSNQKLLKSKSDDHLLSKPLQLKLNTSTKKQLLEKDDNEIQKQGKSRQQNLLKKKTVTSVQNAKYRLNFKNPQKSYFRSNNNQPSLGVASPHNISSIQRSKCFQKNNSNVSEQQQILEVNKSKGSKNKQIQNSLLCLQNRFCKISYSKTSTPQITKKIIQLQKKIDQQKQKSLKFELEVQGYKNEIKILTKQYKNVQKKCHNYQTQMKKVKKLQTTIMKQNQQLKDLNELLKNKLDQKNEQLNIINQRNVNKQKSFKEQLKNVYQKLQAINRQKQFKNCQNVSLEEKIQKYEKKNLQQSQQKNLFVESEKKKMQKNIKKLQKQYQFIKEFFMRAFKQLGKQIQQMFKKHKNINFSKNYSFQNASYQNSTTCYSNNNFSQYQWNKQYIYLFKQVTSKIQRISIQLHESINQKNDKIERNQKQLRQLKAEIRELCMQLQSTQQIMQKQRQRNKLQIHTLQMHLQQKENLNANKIKQLKQLIRDNEEQIKQLNEGILLRNRQTSSLKILKEQLEQNIKKICSQMQLKIQQHKNYVDQLLQQKQQIGNELRNQIMQLEQTLEMQKIKCLQFKEKSLNYKKNIDRLEIQISQLNQKVFNCQKQLKSAHQTNHLMNKDISQLKNMINQITGCSSKKQKQFNDQNKQLSLQVNSFKQNYKSLQQTKQQIQKNLEKLNSQLTKAKQQRSKMQQDYKKIQKIFNVTQKSSQTLKNSIMDMKRQNQDLKIKLKKKQQFQAQLQDEFQCNFYQIRQKLIYFIQQNNDLQKQKNGFQRQNNFKMKKINLYIQSLTTQLNKVMQYQSKKINQQKKVSQISNQLQKIFNSYEKQGVINVFYANQFRQKISLIDKIYQENMAQYQQLQKQLEEPRKIRAKNSTNLRKVSNNQSNLNQTILRKTSSTTNLMNSQQLNKNYSPNQPRKLVRNKSMITSFQALSKKKDQIKNQRINSFQQSIRKIPSDQIQKTQILINDNLSQNLDEYQQKQKKMKKLQSKLRPLQINKKVQKIDKIQQLPQTYTPTPMPDQKKKVLKRLNTLK